MRRRRRWRQALQGVVVEIAAVGLDAGFAGPKAADALHAVAKSSPQALLDFHLDPLSAFAEAGASPGPIESHLVSAATVGLRLAPTYPKAQLFLASGRVAHEAGGGEALEVAVAATAAIAYAKALVRAGAPVSEAFDRITLGLAADGDYFVTLAKLRAARAVFARIAEASGASGQARIEARSSRRMLAAKDAWTNMIRLTAAGFGAAVGGADAVVLGPSPTRWACPRPSPAAEPQHPARADGGGRRGPRGRSPRRLRLCRSADRPDRPRRLDPVPGDRGRRGDRRGAGRRADRPRRRGDGRRPAHPQDRRRDGLPARRRTRPWRSIPPSRPIRRRPACPAPTASARR
jgi:hypothetical protein